MVMTSATLPRIPENSRETIGKISATLNDEENPFDSIRIIIPEDSRREFRSHTQTGLISQFTILVSSAVLM